jgi:methionyl-tRNA formyltransferase
MKARIVFMGTPDFAVESLRAIVEEGHEVVGVVTTPDKPAGRGHKLQASAVKKYALEKGLNILQPEKLKSETFIDQLKELNADIFVVVAFRMLPKVVWSIPPKGTFNLHGSLLPDYRGAAPINWAVINGENETGVTTFLIDDKIDTGDILLQKKIAISDEDNVGKVHDALMSIGSKLVVETINGLMQRNLKPKVQAEILEGRSAKMAPKIFKETCTIDWKDGSEKVHNLVRGMSPYPAAYFEAEEDGKELKIKVFEARKLAKQIPAGEVKTDDKKYWIIGTGDGAIELIKIQYPGKKPLEINQFLAGKKASNITLKTTKT